jgi:hypothetical protein
MADDPRLEQALRDLEVTANNFALRLARIGEVRTAYVQQIREMSTSIRAAVEAGELSAARGAEVANQMRNEIMEMQRLRDYDLGRALAQKMKTRGVTLEESIAKAMKKLGIEGKPFHELPGPQQREVFLEVIEASGRSRPAVTQAIPRFRWAARGLWVATLAIAAYNIGTSENPWWQSGREAAGLAGGFGGGFAGGAAMGAVGGIWAGPVGVAIGVVVGGILGALLADHAYVEAAGTSDPFTRKFVGRFTSFWTGVDEEAMARALAQEFRGDLTFVRRVFLSLNDDYSTDADDVALEYVNIARRDFNLGPRVRGDTALRDVLIQVLDEGWTSSDELEAIRYLRGH